MFAEPIVPSAPRINAASWLLADANSGHIITEYQADLPIAPASLTKIMTSYVVASQIKQGYASADEEVRISVNAWRTEGSSMFIEAGDRVKVSDLIKGIVIQSGNDASIALAEYIAGGEAPFVELMNYNAVRLGMHNTYFLNATGLPEEGHQSTSRDLFLLTRDLILNFPEHYRLYAEKFFAYGLDRRTGQPIRQRNRNRLLFIDKTVDGVKTGNTEEAGYCLVVSAVRNNMRLISVVMGAPGDESRVQATQKLLTYGFRFFGTFLILESDRSIEPKPEVWGGNKDYFAIGLKDPAWVTIPRGDKDNLVSEVQLQSGLWAPIKTGDEVGTLRTSLHGRVIKEVPLLALEDVTESGFFGRMLDSIGFFLSGLWTDRGG